MIDINNQKEEISSNTTSQQEIPVSTSKKKHIIVFIIFVLTLLIGITIGIYVLVSKNKQLKTQNSTLKTSSFQTLMQNISPTIFVTPIIKEDSTFPLPTGKVEIPADCYPTGIYENLLVCLSIKDKQIHLEDLSAKEIKRITNSEGSKSNIYIYGDYVVWTDDREKKVAWTDAVKHDWISNDVYLYDLKTNKEKKISSVPAFRRELQLYGHYVAWTEQKSDDWLDVELYIYDIAENKIVFSSTVKSHKDNIKLNDNKLVWLDDRDEPERSLHTIYNRKYRVYLYDILTGKEQTVIQYPSYKSIPYIENNTLVWTDNRNNRLGDVYMKDINSSDEILVSSSEHIKQNLGIYKNIIWWNISQPCDVEEIRLKDSIGDGFTGDVVKKPTGLYSFNIETKKEEKIYDSREMFPLSYKNLLLLRDICSKERDFIIHYL